MKRAAVDTSPVIDRWNTSHRPLDAARVLLAEPHRETRQLYREALTLAGCEVFEATDGRDALTQALVRQPTLIITETQLPLIDGATLLGVLDIDSPRAARFDEADAAR